MGTTLKRWWRRFWASDQPVLYRKNGVGRASSTNIARMTLLVTIGVKGRASFNSYLQDLLADDDTSSQVKTAWNSAIQGITS